jgi:hypothetical protein
VPFVLVRFWNFLLDFIAQANTAHDFPNQPAVDDAMPPEFIEIRIPEIVSPRLSATYEPVRAPRIHTL